MDEQILRDGKLSLAKARETISEAYRADARKHQPEAEGLDRVTADATTEKTGKEGQKDATVQDDTMELATG